MGGNQNCPMSSSAKRGRPPCKEILTPAEWHVVHLAQHGLSNREIARRRGVSIDAVKCHVSDAVSKIDLENKRVLRRRFAKPLHSALQGWGDRTNPNVGLGLIEQIARSVHSGVN